MTMTSQLSRTTLSPDTLTTVLLNRTPRASAKSKTEVKVVPIRTCYETYIWLIGPRESVLDYAADLFADAATTRPGPTPPLTVEEAHTKNDGHTLSVLLSRGA